MISKCELYNYNGLFLDNETLEKLEIIKTTWITILTLLNNVKGAIEIIDGRIQDLNKDKFCSSISLNNDYFYMIKNNILIVLSIKVYYGIMADKQVVAIYDNQNVRDVKFNEVLIKKVYAIIDDIKNSEKVLNEFNNKWH